MTDIDTLVARLVVKARKLGLARAEALLLERGGKPALRWRQPRLLWPLIGQTLGSE